MMPFQGNQGRGAIDPNVLSFLLNSQNQRAQNQRMMAKDAFDAQIAQAKFQAEMQAKAREEQRKEELHRETIRTKTLANQATENELYGKASTLLENQSPENARAGYATAASRLSGGNNDVANAITGGPEDQQFLSVVNGLAPGTFDQDAAQLDDAAMFAQLQQVDPALAQALQQAGQQRGLSSAQQIQSGVAQNRLGQIADKKKLDETIAAERRAVLDANRKADYQAGIDANRMVLETETINSALQSKQRSKEKALLNGDTALASRIQADIDGIEARQSAKLTAGQPEGVIRNAALVVKESGELDQDAATLTTLDALSRTEGVLGTPGFVQAFISNAAAVGADLGVAIVPSLDNYMVNSDAPEEEKQRVYNFLVRGIDADNTPVQAARLEEVRSRWLILNSLDPGRVAVAQLNDIKDPQRFSGLFTSEKRAKENMRVTRRLLRQSVETRQNNLRLLLGEDAKFGPDGRLNFHGPRVPITTEDILQKPSEIPSTNAIPQSARERLADPNATLQDVINAAKEAVGKK